jgi:hypothetical protein
MGSRLAFVMVLALGNVAVAGPPLSQDEAVALAEQFVTDNGYTDLPPNLAKVKLEFINDMAARSRKESLAAIVRRRHGELERHAWQVLSGRRHARGWTIVFRFPTTAHGGFTLSEDIESSNRGRAVTMDPDGGNIRMEHVDVRVDLTSNIRRRPRH